MSRLPRGPAWLCGTLFACVLIIGFTCTPASAGPAQQDCQPAWHEVFSPPLPSGRADLYGLAVAGPHDIWAVGTAALAENNGQYQTFTEHWDGTMWRTVPSPNRNPDHPIDNRLADVAAVGPRDVWAVGWREALSGTSALGNNQTLIEHWDGTVWSLVPSPNPSPDQANRLVGVAAAGPNDVWAVGQAGAQPLLIHWDGARWMEVSIPSVPDAATGLDSIAVTGPTDIWILGHYYPNNGDWGAAIIHWDGQSWTLTKLTAPMFDPNLTGAILTLRAIAATSPSDAWIAGDLATYAPGPNPKAPPVLLTIQSLIGHWDGSAWKRVESPNPGAPGGGGTLYGIAAAGPRDVWAVGSYFSPSGQQTLTLHWNGNYWVIVPSPNNDPNNNFQYSVVATGPQEAWASGSGMLIHYAGGCSAPSPTPTPKPTDRVPDPHLPGVLYFPVVGHSLQGGFRAYWEAHGGLAQFGYPLTEEFKETSPTDGRVYTVQYFERNRFEWHPENRPPYDILLGLLGDTVTQERRPEAPFRPLVLSPPYPPYYMLTGHIVAPQFVAYWQSHGGLPVYGYPLSEAFTETSPTDGKPYLVQYFERNRLEYHPELPDPFRVSLGLLGVQVLQARGWLP
jgi:hypothetical protein